MATATVLRTEPSAADLDAVMAEREELRRLRLETYLLAPGAHDGQCVQWYGREPSETAEQGYYCLICGHSAPQKTFLRHEPGAEHCQREFADILAMADWLSQRGIRPDLRRRTA